MPRKDAGGGAISAQAQQDLVSEGIENFELPRSLVTKIAKSALPENAKLQKETVLSLVKGSTVFINYLGDAHDVALSKQHKSIAASDVLKALEMLELGDLVDPLQNELQVYRDNTKGDKNRKSGVDRNGSLSTGKGKEIESISSVPQSKGKAKAVLPPPFTTLPRPAVPSVSQATEDVNMSVRTEENQDAGEGEGAGGGDYDSEMEDEVEGAVEQTEEDELMDLVADESEELRRDAAGLDETDLGGE
ncbi:histone-fold-containing protein [Boletus reticuloceps]|uniref:DNA polymerase epsilon subunit D n=1 Tax=Boletus reticuloceps TaxID=495285 RepID=A0A8I2YDA8_9AGAM|nr:histone-fold-containing protein [Boletus reticuloceps]KAG6369999.1 histone-fold-containing protein [Boletus reticuloceps]